MTKIQVILGDISRCDTEAIVNAANKYLIPGTGVAAVISRGAGIRLFLKLITMGGCKTGEAKITKGYNLPAKYIIHTVGPIWHGGDKGEEDLLTSCYKNSLALAVKQNIKSISFPCIATGAHGFPAKKAAEIAVRTARTFIAENNSLELINFVCYSKADEAVYKEILK